MKKNELFKACTAQCDWCKEQWPVKATGGHMLHVGPFTKDPQLFSLACKAEPIREAFEYVGYDGGKQVVWKPRPAKVLHAIVAGRKLGHKSANGFGFCKNLDSPKSRSFWRTCTRAVLEVAGWPEWMQSCSVTGEKSERVTEERLKGCREDLLFWDECDFACRQPCTENLQYRPLLDRNWSKPTCNDGMGCMVCWERYERAVNDWEEKNPSWY
jgi:hypothetical protein